MIELLQNMQQLKKATITIDHNFIIMGGKKRIFAWNLVSK